MRTNLSLPRREAPLNAPLEARDLAERLYEAFAFKGRSFAFGGHGDAVLQGFEYEFVERRFVFYVALFLALLYLVERGAGLCRGSPFLRGTPSDGRKT